MNVCWINVEYTTLDVRRFSGISLKPSKPFSFVLPPSWVLFQALTIWNFKPFLSPSLSQDTQTSFWASQSALSGRHRRQTGGHVYKRELLGQEARNPEPNIFTLWELWQGAIVKRTEERDAAGSSSYLVFISFLPCVPVWRKGPPLTFSHPVLAFQSQPWSDNNPLFSREISRCLQLVGVLP